MISVSGKRGIGKTYMLAKKLYQRSKEGYFCISNFSHLYANVDCSRDHPEVLFEIIRELGVFKDRGYELVDLDPRFKHSGVFIAIDEAHLYFSADQFKRYQTDERFANIIKFLAQARKADVEIWYSTQDPAKVDKNWRRYTESYIRYVPVVPISYKKMVLQKREPLASGIKLPPFYRREVRYVFPLVWEEMHRLDADNPTFDYSTVTDANGNVHLSPRSTLEGRKLVRSGWLDPFPYKLYDSYQMLSIIEDAKHDDDFRHLARYGFTDHLMRPEPLPTFKGMLGIPKNDEVVPTKFLRTDVHLPDIPVKEPGNTNVLKQPIEFLDDLAFINRTYGARGRAGPPRVPAADAAPHPFFARQEKIVIEAEKERFHPMPDIDGVTGE